MAAGLGFKTFVTGDILTAADANGYLMSQTVMVFADAAARTAAITSPQEGMITYLKDTNSTEYYSGSAWVSVGGGSPLTTKGDLYTYSTTNARLAVGSDGQTLVADSTAATGLKWASAGSSGLTLVGTTALSGSGSFNIANCFSATYDNYLITFSEMQGSTNSYAPFGLRTGSTNATSNYKVAGFYSLFSSAALNAQATTNQGQLDTIEWGSSTTTNGAGSFLIMNPYKAKNTLFYYNEQTDSAVVYRSGSHSVATSYDSLWFTVNSGTVSGNISIYGLAK
jgi:hypothetical protein